HSNTSLRSRCGLTSFDLRDGIFAQCSLDRWAYRSCVRRTRPYHPSKTEQEGRDGDKRISVLLILVKNHTINHYVVTCPNIVNPDGNTHSNSRFHNIWIQNFTAACHISHRLPEVVGARSAGFLQHDCASRSVFRDSAVALCCGRGCRGLRNLSPGKWSRQG